MPKVICLDQDQEGFAAEIQSMEAFYGPAPPAFRVIDREGTLTYIHEKRPENSPEP